MSFTTDPRRGPVAALRARWWIGLLLVVVGAAVGAAVGSVQQTQYTAEARLIVGADDLSSYQVAGFAEASQELASNYARYVDNSSTVSEALRKDLGSRDDQLLQISASPIPQSSVVSVQTVATSQAIAVDAARSVANTLVTLTSAPAASAPSTLLSSYVAIAKRAASADEDVTRLTKVVNNAKNPSTSQQNQLASAKLQASTLDLQRTAAANRYQDAVSQPTSQSQLHIVQASSLIAKSRSQTLQIYTISGAIVGLIVALVLVALLERRAVRRSAGRRHAAPIDGA